jgi:hypothetical protein
MGTACTRANERMGAALGLIKSASTRFERCLDVAMGGVLAGLPALCSNGLLSGLGRHLSLPAGYYNALHILTLLGFMALARIRRPEGLRHVPPGELGKVVGLDRVPEVRTLREKIAVMANTGAPQTWMRELSRTWMEADPEEAGYLYVDGHVRVYHGASTLLPRRYVSRERLCLRGTTDYWINDALGRPFFVVSKAVTDGLAATLLDEIVPDLLASVPAQPSAADLAADPLLHRFAVIFDLSTATLHHDGGAIQKRAERLEHIQQLDVDIAALRLTRRHTPKKVTIASLPQDQRPRQLAPLGKMLTDTVKMIAYRAETALVGLVRPHLAKEEDARALVRELFVSSADLEPDEHAHTLTIRTHRMACPAHDKAMSALLVDLTQAAFCHPETGMRLIYELA